MAKGFYNLVFREGVLEDIHAAKLPIGQKEMEALNRSSFNRIGFMFNLLHKGENEKFEKLCMVGAVPLSYFDPLDLSSKEVKHLERTLKASDEFLKIFSKR